MESMPETNPWLSAITQATTRSNPPEYAFDQWFNAWQANTPRPTGQPELRKEGEGTAVQAEHEAHPEDPEQKDRPDSPGTQLRKPSRTPSEPIVISFPPSPPSSPVVINFGSQPSRQSGSPRGPPLIDFGTPDSDAVDIQFGSPMESPRSPPLIDFQSPTESPQGTLIIDFGSPFEDSQSALPAVIIRSPTSSPPSPPVIDFASPPLSPRTPMELDFDWQMESPSSQIVVDFGEADGCQSESRRSPIQSNELAPLPNHPSMRVVDRPLSPLEIYPGSPIDMNFGSPTPPQAEVQLPEATGIASSSPGVLPPDNMLGDFTIPQFLLFEPNAGNHVTHPAVFPYEEEKAKVVANYIVSAPATPRGSATPLHPDFLGIGPDASPDANLSPLMGYSPNIKAATRYGYATVPGKRILPSFVGVIVSRTLT